MSAPQIPNLLDSLRASKSARSERGRRNEKPNAQSEDKIVQRTDDDAAGSRLSAADVGHLHDPFARLFATSQEAVRRMPIINRGTYVRTVAIDSLVQQFLDRHAGEPTQIISLGAGTDTRFFRMMQKDPSLGKTLHYHEIDFPSTTLKKIKAIEAAPSIIEIIQSSSADDSETSGTRIAPNIAADKTSLTSPSYSIHAFDLRDLARENAPRLSGVSDTAATLILSECCLTYLSPSDSNAILKHLASNVVARPAALEITLYEPIHPHDAFGRTMVSNLSVRGISMPGLEAFPTLADHRERLRNVGFQDLQGSWDINQIWEQWIPPEEKERLRRMEMVDEEEEWMLLAGHYGIIRAARTRENTSTSSEGGQTSLKHAA